MDARGDWAALPHLLDYDTTMKAAAYLTINPMGKVPAIRQGDIVVTEAAAICAYLADVFPEARFAPPAGDRLRGPYYRWFISSLEQRDELNWPHRRSSRT